MLKKIFISAVLLLAVLSFVVSMLKGNNNGEKTVSVPDRVAVINISGTIMSGTDSNDNLFNQSSGVTSGSIMKQIREAAADDSVKALVLRIDSGGGSATAAEEIGRELKRFKEKTKKPVVATMGNTGASAAYWIAVCASDKVYANATTLTGSIGVYMPYMNTEELFKKIGIQSNKIKSGPYKDRSRRYCRTSSMKSITSLWQLWLQDARWRKARCAAWLTAAFIPVCRRRILALLTKSVTIMMPWQQQVSWHS